MRCFVTTSGRRAAISPNEGIPEQPGLCSSRIPSARAGKTWELCGRASRDPYLDAVNPDLSIVIVSWNTWELLAACLDSVFRTAEGLALEVIVVDNASSDCSPAMVRERFPHVQLIENRENTGFATANNQVFPLCTAEFILLLNSDTVVKPGALRTLRDFLRENPDVTAVGPKLIHPRVQLRILGAGRQPTLRTVTNHHLFLASAFPRIRFLEGIYLFIGKHDDRPRQVEWLSGACLLVRRKVIAEVGPLSESFFMYCEDMEWCDRMRTKGTLYHVPDAVVEHHLSASTEKNQKASLLPITTARDYFIARNRPTFIALFAHDVVRTVGLLVRAIGYFVMSLFQPDRRAMWRGRSRQYFTYTRAALPGRSRDKSQRER